MHRHRLVGARDREASARVLEVVLGHLELVGDDPLRLRDHLLGGVVEGDSADGETAAPVRVQPELHHRGVAVDHLDLLDRDPEPVGDDLRERRHVALPVRRGADQDLDGPGREAADRGGVPAAGAVADRAEDPRRSEAAHLDVGRQTDADLLRVAASAPLGLVATEPVVVDELERLVERGVEVAGVDLEPGRDRLGKLGDEVLAPKLDGIHVQLERERVHRPLDRIRRLRAARAAIGVCRGRVREDADALEVVRLHVVAPRVEPGAEERHPGRDELHVGAHRGGQPDADGGDLPVLGRRELDLLQDVAPVDGRHVGLGALLRPLDRKPEPPCEHEAQGLLRVDVELRAEPTADVGGDDPELGLRDPRRSGEGHPRDVRDLRRRPHRVLIRREHRLHEDAPRLDRVRDQPLLAVVLLHGDRRLGEEPVDLARLQRPGVRAVLLVLVVDERGRVAHRLPDVSDSRERLVVDLDELRGVLRERTALGNDDRDAVPRVARLVRAQRPVLGNVAVAGDGPCARQRARPFVGEVGPRERRHDAVRRLRLREVDLRDLRVRVRAAHDRHPEHPGEHHVVDPARLAAKQACVLFALDRGADVVRLHFGGRHLASPQAAAAALTALTMLT